MFLFLAAEGQALHVGRDLYRVLHQGLVLREPLTEAAEAAERRGASAVVLFLSGEKAAWDLGLSPKKKLWVSAVTEKWTYLESPIDP